ncbi:MAG: hypothetical protein GC171_04065 [Terrimonas sp.]|nr:hypothetical protein [Terrimonas sp.]
MKKAIFMSMLLFFGIAMFLHSCKKSDSSFAAFEEKKSTPHETIQPNETPGLKRLLSLPQLSKEIKSSLNLNDYKFFEKEDNSFLWLVAIKSNTLGFSYAKVAIYSSENDYSMIFLSYDFNVSTYRPGVISSYSGVTSIYDQKKEKKFDFIFEKGILKRVDTANCINCSLCHDCPPAYDPTDWCSVWPPLCNYQGSSYDPGLPMTPPEEGGTSNGGTNPYLLLSQQLNSILNPGDNYYFDDNVTASNGMVFNSVAAFSEFLNNTESNTTYDLTTASQINQDGDTKIETGKINFGWGAGVNIFVKLNNNTGKWGVSNVTSEQWGLTLAWTWEQEEFTQSTTGDEITIDVFGTISYKLFLQSIGIIYRTTRHYQIKINTITGKMTALSQP